MILAPNPAKGESCRDKAAQICIDWLRWGRDVSHPAMTMMLWLVRVGNRVLARKLDHTGVPGFLGEILEREKENRRKKGNMLRQRSRRIRKKGTADLVAKISRQTRVNVFLLVSLEEGTQVRHKRVTLPCRLIKVDSAKSASLDTLPSNAREHHET